MNALQKSKRETNFELLRIVSMFMIVILHFNNFGHILVEQSNYNMMQYYIFEILEYISIIAVNLFVLISGYFMVKSKINLKKIITLELEVLFYSFFIYIILVFTGQIIFSKSIFLKLLFPVITGQYWFITAYMALYILIPFINKFIDGLNKKDYKILLIILTFLLSILGTYSTGKIIFDGASGYSLVWFIYLYLVAGYLRLYFDINKEYKFIGKITKLKLFGIYLLVILLQMIIFILYNNFIEQKDMLYLGYNNPLVLISSLIIFLIFSKITINNTILNKIIINVSPLVLAVYLIHNHPSFIYVLWDKILKPVTYIGSPKMFVIFIVDVILIFVACCLIEKIRQIIFKFIGRIELFKNISDKVNKKIEIS